MLVPFFLCIKMFTLLYVDFIIFFLVLVLLLWTRVEFHSCIENVFSPIICCSLFLPSHAGARHRLLSPPLPPNIAEYSTTVLQCSYFIYSPLCWSFPVNFIITTIRHVHLDYYLLLIYNIWLFVRLLQIAITHCIGVFGY